MKQFILSILFCFPLLAQAPIKAVNGLGKELILGAAGKVYNSNLTAVTTTPTAFTATTTKVQVIHCTNITAGAVTVTIEDGNDVDYFTATSMAANSVMVVQYGTVGLTYTSGIKFSASANSSIKCQVEGVQ
jgi:hypothetical protein